ncbi:hypothetical protein ACJ72_00496 [Emergomyces africanus]|uniref:Uncharacterized protein n=1 Tax=Emergomyces africanus TaxID=1955775 RepID=A0A1B7P7W9_9EURO|nr:hypothetical protein ACJ72_00496 [Emergomyces africanus]
MAPQKFRSVPKWLAHTFASKDPFLETHCEAVHDWRSKHPLNSRKPLAQLQLLQHKNLRTPDFANLFKRVTLPRSPWGQWCHKWQRVTSVGTSSTAIRLMSRTRNQPDSLILLFLQTNKHGISKKMAATMKDCILAQRKQKQMFSTHINSTTRNTSAVHRNLTARRTSAVHYIPLLLLTSHASGPQKLLDVHGHTNKQFPCSGGECTSRLKKKGRCREYLVGWEIDDAWLFQDETDHLGHLRRYGEWRGDILRKGYDEKEQ